MWWMHVKHMWLHLLHMMIGFPSHTRNQTARFHWKQQEITKKKNEQFIKEKNVVLSLDWGHTNSSPLELELLLFQTKKVRKRENNHAPFYTHMFTGQWGHAAFVFLPVGLLIHKNCLVSKDTTITLCRNKPDPSQISSMHTFLGYVPPEKSWQTSHHLRDYHQQNVKMNLMFNVTWQEERERKDGWTQEPVFMKTGACKWEGS